MNRVPTQEEVAKLKAKFPAVILLFRAGDFYEAFGDDARTMSELLGITLTSRKGEPLTGIPYHSVERYLLAMIKAGHRVAIVDGKETTQWDDPLHPVFAGL
jgi:DNA mismatch repair protein MutS